MPTNANVKVFSIVGGVVGLVGLALLGFWAGGPARRVEEPVLRKSVGSTPAPTPIPTPSVAQVIAEPVAEELLSVMDVRPRPKAAAPAPGLTPREQSAVNLATMGKALATFSKGNAGAMPEDLGALAYVTGTPVECFVNPASGKTVPNDLKPEEWAKWVFCCSDYEYIPGLKNAGPGTVVAYEIGETAEGIQVLFKDGHVELMSLERAKLAIKQSEAQAEPQGPRG